MFVDAKGQEVSGGRSTAQKMGVGLLAMAAMLGIGVSILRGSGVDRRDLLESVKGVGLVASVKKLLHWR